MPHSTDSHTPSLATLSFEDALGELEQIVRNLESGKMTLENALKAYERGAQLRSHCETRLGEAEMRVKAIVQKADGSLEEAPLDEGGSPARNPSPAPRKRAGKTQQTSPEPASGEASSGHDLDGGIPF